MVKGAAAPLTFANADRPTRMFMRHSAIVSYACFAEKQIDATMSINKALGVSN